LSEKEKTTESEREDRRWYKMIYDDLGGSLLALLIYTESSTNTKTSTNLKRVLGCA
jgi:hypothetical protein